MFGCLRSPPLFRFAITAQLGCLGLVVRARDAAPQIGAQSIRHAQAVVGIVYDSLRRAPLSAASVALTGTTLTTLTDYRGRFRFDSVPPGTYSVTAQHAAFDSVGLSGASIPITVREQTESVTVLLPSFAKLWSAACGRSIPTVDSSFVFGTVRYLRPRIAPTAIAVTAVWITYESEKTSVRARRWRMDVQADASGSYAICGIPAGLSIEIGASAGTSASGPVELLPSPHRIQRQDLILGAEGDSASVGVVTGLVRTDSGEAIAGARILLLNGGEVRSDEHGKFVLRRVPTGTQQINAFAIGWTSGSAIVHVQSSESTEAEIVLSRVTLLDRVNVSATTVRSLRVSDFEDRRKAGLGHFFDSTTIAQHPDVVSNLADVPGVVVRPPSAEVQLPSLSGAGKCVAHLWIDGTESDPSELGRFYPAQIAAMEVYTRVFNTPAQFVSRARHGNLCGAVVVWTKRAFP